MRHAAVVRVVIVLAALAVAGGVRGAVSMGIIEDDPEVVKQRWREKAEEWYKEGMKARAAGDTKNAVRYLLRCAKLRLDSPHPEQAFNTLKVITEEARQELEVARQLIAGEDRVAGLSELNRVSQTYFGLWPAKEAGKLMRQLEADPKFRAHLKTDRLAEQLAEAETLEADAAALGKPPAPAPAEPAPEEAGPTGKLPTEPPTPRPQGVVVATVETRELTAKERAAARLEKLLAAYEIYGRVAKSGAGTDPGRRAADARRRLESDPDLLARIKRAQALDQAREWLSLARNYFRAGRFDSARTYCEKVVAACPKTPEAAEARMILARIK